MFRASLAGGFEIRPVEAGDAAAVYATVDANRIHLREWLFWVDATETVADTQAWVDLAVENHRTNHALTSVIWDGGQVAGVIGTHAVEWVYRKCEIGYWLAKPYVGRGVMTAAVTALLDHLFHDCNLHRIECQCATGNTKSCAIPERLGFTREGVAREALCLGDMYHDLVVWSLLRHEWRG